MENLLFLKTDDMKLFIKGLVSAYLAFNTQVLFRESFPD
jgi:hypothetical protein